MDVESWFLFTLALFVVLGGLTLIAWFAEMLED